MTRETKIGLLVGLAFIIVIGILFSDYLSSNNEPGAAPLKVAGDMLRSGLGEPGNDDVAPVLRAPAAITPSQPVVINAELNHHSAAQPPVRFVQPSLTDPAAPQGAAITPSAPLNQPLTIAERLRQAAEQQGEQLVPANTPPAANDANPPAAAQANGQKTAATGAKTTARTYQAEPGDTLGLIAQKAYGSGCKANREAIVAANPSLAQNRDLVVAGRTYIIPALATATAATPATPSQSQPSEKPSDEKTLIYVVQPHDTLWSIAMDQVGNAGAVAAIEDLNKVVLNGSDRVRPNMKLKLPERVTRNAE